jgi:putative transposase
LCGKLDFLFLIFGHFVFFQHKWLDNAIQPEADSSIKENKWTQSIAVGSKAFIEKIKETHGYRAIGRRIFGDEESFVLREGQTP